MNGTNFENVIALQFKISVSNIIKLGIMSHKVFTALKSLFNI